MLVSLHCCMALAFLLLVYGGGEEEENGGLPNLQCTLLTFVIVNCHLVDYMPVSFCFQLLCNIPSGSLGCLEKVSPVVTVWLCVATYLYGHKSR